MMDTVALFVYDELKDAEILNAFFQCNIKYQTAYLKDYVLCIDAKGEYFLQDKKGSTVEGYLLFPAQEQIWQMDQWKGLQAYTREEHPVFSGDRSFKAWTYNKKGTCLRHTPEFTTDNRRHKERLLLQMKAFRDQVAVSSYPVSDLYIFIPCNIDKTVDYSKGKQIPAIAERYIKQLNLVSAYEFDNNLTNTIERSFLDNIEVICETDEFENKSELGRQRVNIFVTWHPNTNIAIVTVAIPVISVSITHLLDQMARSEIFIQDMGRDIDKINMIEWLANIYCLTQVGTPRAYVNLSSPPGDMQMLHLLATEAVGNQIYGEIVGQNFKEAAKFNIAQYEYSDIHVAETCVVQVFKEFAGTYETRLMRQILTIFSIELILFQDAAISRVNRKAAMELQKQQLSKKDAFKIIEKLSMEFAKTIVFWDLRNFRYETTQSVADAIAKAFRIREEMDVYKENKEFLEHLITIHTARTTEQENRNLNSILVFLAVCQVAPVFYGITLCLLKGDVEASNFIATAISISAFAFMLGILKLLNRRNR